MKVNVCFSWCDYFFQWTIDRKLPVLPSKGDCLSIIQPGDDSFVDEKDNERYKNIRMKGCGKYEGYSFELWQLFIDPDKVKVNTVVWKKNYVDLWITTTCWEEGTDHEWYWEAIDPDGVLI